VNALDILVIVLVVVFTGLGVYQGLIKSVSSFVAIIGGLLLAKRFSIEVSQFLTVLHVEDVRGVMGFIVVFLFFFIIIKVFMHFLQKILNASVLATFDTVFGGLFGFLKGFILALMVVAILQVVLPKNSAILVNSKTLPVTKQAAIVVMGFVPAQMQPYIHQTTRRIIK
jgi:membrane protein required for colicin V production